MSKQINEIISTQRYGILKRSSSILNDEQRAEIEAYELAQKEELKQKNKEYNKKVNAPVVKPDFKPTYDGMLKGFKQQFSLNEKVEFDNNQLENINTLFYYFLKDERFFKCKNLSNLNQPSFDKGLLIIGDFGVGKSVTMYCLHKLFLSTPLGFRFSSALDIVTTYEGCATEQDKTDFWSSQCYNTKYFDDVKTERDANNYGRVNLFKEILEKRERNRAKTFITCNYAENDTTNNLDKALMEFNTKYGGRVYDRLFYMFNIIEFKGTSLRI